MREQKDIPADDSVFLSPQELIAFEYSLKDAMAEFLDFTSYSLYFPESLPRGAVSDNGKLVPVYREKEHELLLPLVLKGRLLGYFLARGVRLAAPKTAPGYIMALATAVLEKQLLYKVGITDALTGLHTREYFLNQLGREIELIQSNMLPPVSGESAADEGEGADSPLPGFSACLGVIFLDLDCFQWINENYGYLVGDDIVSEVGRLLRLLCPKYVVASRFANDKFALFLPDARPKACFQLGEVIREGISRLSFEDDVTGDRITITGSIGYVNYPQNLSGSQFRRSASEQARIMIRKARKAVTTAKDHGRNRVFAYGDILKKGGKVLEVLPLRRLAVSLGRSVDAREGQRFLVSSPRYMKNVEARITEDERIVGRYPPMYKAEVVLIEVQEEMAFAEIMHLGDPSWEVEPGDMLTVVSEDESFFEPETEDRSDSMLKKDSITGLYDYRDFVSWWTEARMGCPRFSLSLIKFMEQPRERSGNFQKYMDAQMVKVTKLVRRFLGSETVGGRFGLNGLICYFPDAESKELHRTLKELVLQAKGELNIELAVGTASYPCLTFGREDVLENCRKALDHALLLAHPRNAAFDSVSLNISADKLYMEGDSYGAIEEFKLSLLADESNAVARNSLGICYAQLNRFGEAVRQFEAVIAGDPEDTMALYNLGWACQRLGDFKRAGEAYRACLEYDPNHVFSLIRLGNLAERDKNPDAANEYYLEASRLPGGEPLTMRHLARLALARGEDQEAREYLHLALNANHNDARAMHLLAKLYLDTGEDPQIAEVLARQSSALMPGKQEYWDLLVRSLEEQGKDEEAAKAAARGDV